MTGINKYYNYTIIDNNTVYRNKQSEKPLDTPTARATLGKIHYILTNNFNLKDSPLSSEGQKRKLQSDAQSVQYLYSETKKNRGIFKKIEIFFESFFCKLFKMKTNDEIITHYAKLIERIDPR